MKKRWTSYNKEAYEKVGKKYDILRPLFIYSHLSKHFADHIRPHLKKNSKILDVGCGTGNSTKFIDNIAENCEITGIDQAANMLKAAKHKNFKNKILFKQVNIELFSSPKKFDLIQFFQVIHHINDMDSVIEPTMNALNKGGKIIFIDTFSDEKIVKFLTAFYTKFMGQGKYKKRNVKNMKSELRKHNLQIVKETMHPFLKNYSLIIASKVNNKLVEK